ncbi:MAG: hypothetical protein ACLQBD_03875 [Syntrophobacteraceae bacterium]
MESMIVLGLMISFLSCGNWPFNLESFRLCWGEFEPWSVQRQSSSFQSFSHLQLAVYPEIMNNPDSTTGSKSMMKCSERKGSEQRDGRNFPWMSGGKVNGNRLIGERSEAWIVATHEKSRETITV